MTSPDISYLRRLISPPPRHNPPHSGISLAYGEITWQWPCTTICQVTKPRPAPDSPPPFPCTAPGPATRSSEGFGHWTPEKINVAGKPEGVLYLREKNLDIFFITLEQIREALLAVNDVQRLRDQRVPLTLAVPEHDIGFVSDRAAVHQWQLEGAAVCPGVQ